MPSLLEPDDPPLQPPGGGLLGLDQGLPDAGSGLGALYQIVTDHLTKQRTATPVWPADNPVGTERIGDQSLTMPSADFMPARSVGGGMWGPERPISQQDYDAFRQGSEQAYGQLSLLGGAEGAPGGVGGAPGPRLLASRRMGTPGPVRGPAADVAPAPDVPGFTAYHGSPHDFDAFDSSKIGTGEGAQAYGHGLYLADAEAVARGYRDKLAPSNDLAIDDAKSLLSDNKGDFDAAMRENADMWKDPNGLQRKQVDTVLQHWQQHGVDTTVPIPQGRMYEVNIAADPAHFLDWDKPLSEQHPVVQDALQNIPWAEPYLKTSFTGGQIAPKTAEGSQQLADAGIPGIRYLDAGSRRPASDFTQIEAGIADRQQQVAMLQREIDMNQGKPDLLPPFFQQRQAQIAQHQNDIAIMRQRLDTMKNDVTRNTVVFDPRILTIMRKYAIPAAMLSGTGHGLVTGSDQQQ